MATHRRSKTGYNRVHSSAVYSPAYEGNAVRVPRREEELGRTPAHRPKRRKQVQHYQRIRARVREAGQIAPFSVLGFLAVALFAVMLVNSYVKLTVANDEMVTLRKQLSALQDRNSALAAEYEKVFDLDTIQAAVGDTMVRPTNDQVVYIDLSTPDTVTLYQDGEFHQGMQGLLDGVKELLGGIIEYFR